MSGAGKSTLVRLLKEPLTAFSDDRVIVRVDGKEITLSGTPWAGEALVAEPHSAPLTGLAFLHHASATEARALTRQEALHQLLPSLSVPWFEKQATTDVLAVAERLLDCVPAHELRFRPHSEVGEVIASLL